jgi:hypothetical protein
MKAGEGKRWWLDEKGLQTLEWVAIGLVILALVGAVAFWITYRASESTGRTVEETIAHFFECVKRMDLDCVREGFGSAGQPQARRDLGWCLTHPVDCWREVVWPTIQRGARAFWDGVKWVGRQIAEAGRRAWAWVVQQWNTWLKGAVAGLLAAIVVIGLIALAVLGGLITLPVAVIAAILVLVATIGVGIWQQMQGKGFWECFGSALMVGFLVAGLVISLSAALAGGWAGVIKWLLGALQNSAIATLLDLIMRPEMISQAFKGDQGALQEIGLTFASSLLISLCTFGFMKGFKAQLPEFKGRSFNLNMLINRIKWIFSTPVTKQLFLSVLSVISVNIFGSYTQSRIMGKSFDLGESLITSMFMLPIVAGLEAIGWNKWVVDSIETVSEWSIKNLYKNLLGGNK